MSTCTAELIIGKADQNHSGIQFNHRLTLYENSRSVLVMERKPSLDDGGQLLDRWVPHPDRVLADAMVMLAGYGAGDQAVLELIADMKEGWGRDGDILDLHEVDPGLMDKLYAATRKAFTLQVEKTRHYIISDRWKVIACLFRSCSIQDSLGLLREYDIDIEICRSCFQSEYSPWSDRIDVWGELQ